MKKILIVLPALSRGGAERQCIKLSNELSSKGYIIDLVTLKNTNDWNSKETSCFSKRFSGFTHLIKLLFSRNYDIHFFWMSIPILIGRIFYSSKNKFTYRASKPNTTIKWLFYLTRRSKYHNSFNSNTSRRNHIQNKWVCKENAHVISNYVQKIKRTESLNNQDSKDFNFAMIAHYRRNKDHLTVVKAIEILKNENIKFKFHFFGNPGNNNELENMIKEYHIEDYCVVHGLVPNPWIEERIDINILSSHYEGFPNSVIEGSSLGIPYILSDIPELKEVHSEINGGFMFKYQNSKDLSDIMKECIHKNYSEELGQSSKNRVSEIYQDKKITELWERFLGLES